MAKRFSVRKIKVGSYSRQGWLLSDRESFAVYDREWRAVAKRHGFLYDYEQSARRYMYVDNTEWNNKDFVKAIADELNKMAADPDFNITGNTAYFLYNKILKDAGVDYAGWCNKFSKTPFRPTEKFQKV